MTPAKWERLRLGDFAPLQYGKSLPERRRANGPVPVFGSNGPVGVHDTALVTGPMTVIGRKGSVGRVHYASGGGWPIDTTFYVADDPKRDPYFTFALLSTLGLDQMNADSAVPGLNRNQAHDLLVMVPPLPLQRRIAAVLGALDDLIETNERLIDGGWSVMKNAYEKYATGADRLPMSEVLNLKYGKSLPSRCREAGPYPVVGSGGVVGSHSHGLVCGPGIVVGRKGSIGRLTWVDVDFFPIDTTFFVETELPFAYAFFMLSQLPLAQMNTDSAVPGLNRANALAQLVAVPGPAELDRFQRLSEPLIEMSRALTGEVDSLRTARSELLPLLMSGRVSPGEVDMGV